MDWDNRNRIWHCIIKPKVNSPGPVSANPNHTRIIAHLRTGVIYGLKSHPLNRKDNNNNTCTTCNKYDNVRHFLFYCINYTDIRQQLKIL